MVRWESAVCGQRICTLNSSTSYDVFVHFFTAHAIFHVLTHTPPLYCLLFLRYFHEMASIAYSHTYQSWVESYSSLLMVNKFQIFSSYGEWISVGIIHYMPPKYDELSRQFACLCHWTIRVPAFVQTEPPFRCLKHKAHNEELPTVHFWRCMILLFRLTTSTCLESCAKYTHEF